MRLVTDDPMVYFQWILMWVGIVVAFFAIVFAIFFIKEFINDRKAERIKQREIESRKMRETNGR